jgi:hypothetical protein
MGPIGPRPRIATQGSVVYTEIKKNDYVTVDRTSESYRLVDVSTEPPE